MSEDIKQSDLINSIINVVSPNLTPQEFRKAQSMMKQQQDILNHCKNGSVKLTQQLIDIDAGLIFPVYSNDNLESIIKRYVKYYPIETAELVKEVKLRLDTNEFGWSKNKSIKFKVSVPAIILSAGKAISPDYWEHNNGEKLDQFAVLCPKLAAKRMPTK